MDSDLLHQAKAMWKKELFGHALEDSCESNNMNQANIS